MPQSTDACSSHPLSAVEALPTAIIIGGARPIADIHIEGTVTVIDNMAPLIGAWSDRPTHPNCRLEASGQIA